jgi:hypothetical protein
MQKGHFLQFACQTCQHPVTFSVFGLSSHGGQILCSHCNLIYDFSDTLLQDQLKQFEDLCHQIHLSESILAQTNIGVHVGDKEVKIPFKLLLTRFNTTLNLKIGQQPLSIIFRIEPLRDLPEKQS